MNLEVLKELFSAHLGPINTNIANLQEGQKEIIEIIKIQTQHTVDIENIKKDVDDCAEKVENIKETKNNRLWEVVRLLLASIFGASIAKLWN